MNWVLIGTIFLIAIYALKGYYNGFLKTILSIFFILAAMILSIAIVPKVSQRIQKDKDLMSNLTKKIESILAIDDQEIDKAGADAWIDKLYLPKSIKDGLKENNNPEVYKSLIVKNFSQYISKYIAIVIINACTFLVLFLLLRISFTILARLLNIISRLPIINGLNKTAGLIVGVLKGVIVVWVLCIVITAMSGTKLGKAVYRDINRNVILSNIYNNNLLLDAVVDIAKGLL